MERSWVIGGIGGLLLASVVWARPGTVKTFDGQTITGDITEQRDQVIVQTKNIESTIARQDIRSVTYFDSTEQECHRRLAKLTPYDVAGRVELAQWLLERKAYDLALEVLQDARRIQPRNEDVAQMTRTVARQLELDRSEARKRAPVELAAADGRPGVAAPATPAGRASSGRLLTPEEINFVKQSEWIEGQQVRVNFRNDVRRKYIAQSGVAPAEFNRLNPSQQAWAIVKNGTPEMRKDVLVTSDPPAMMGYKKVQQSLLQAGCANCHSGEKAMGNFSLHLPADNEAATYTNFIILQKYKYASTDRSYAMIERERPEDSALVQFALPPDIGNPPHPKAPNYKGAVKTKGDVRLKAAIDWISSLTPIVPDYSQIDLSAKPATGAPPRATTRPATPPAR